MMPDRSKRAKRRIVDLIIRNSRSVIGPEIPPQVAQMDMTTAACG